MVVYTVHGSGAVVLVCALYDNPLPSERRRVDRKRLRESWVRGEDTHPRVWNRRLHISQNVSPGSMTVTVPTSLWELKPTRRLYAASSLNWGEAYDRSCSAERTASAWGPPPMMAI